MKKWVFPLVVLVGVGILAKKTNFLSYARASWSMAKAEVADSIPTPFELKRVRMEIAQLDKDILQLIRPLAEWKSAMAQLNKDMQRQQASLDEQKESLLTRTRDLQREESRFVYAGKSYSLEQVRQSVERDFESYQRQEKNLAALKKLFDAKQASFEAAQEQLSRLQAKKREFELRLAQLETEEETLNVARVASKLPVDDHRAGQIEQSLQDIERRQQTQRFELELANGINVGPAIPVSARSAPGNDVQSIHDYLSKGER
jgi:chromosome segregation ATPase